MQDVLYKTYNIYLFPNDFLKFFIFMRKIIGMFTFSTFQFNHIISFFEGILNNFSNYISGQIILHLIKNVKTI